MVTKPLTTEEFRAVNRVLDAARAYVAYERRQIKRGVFTDVMDREQRALHAAVDALEAAAKKKMRSR